MAKFNRKIFFDGFRERLDSTIEQEQVDGLNFLLDKMESDPFWKFIPQVAYALATIFHETAGSFQPVEEGYYLGSAAKVKAFQKKLRYYPHYGRGYVQLTWPANYVKAGKALDIDLMAHPEKALEPEVAYRILTLGMHKGWFTGKKLDDYIKGNLQDYVNARRIINGTDKAGLIAGYARSFEKILTDSAVTQTKDVELKDEPSNDPQKPTTQSPDAQPPIVPEAPVSVETVVAEKEETVDEKLTKWSARWMAIPATATTFLAGVGSWLTSSPVGITITLIIAGCIVAAIYFGLRQIAAMRKASKESELKLQREKQAHELQMALIAVGSSKEHHTVVLTPPTVSMPNSDPEDKTKAVSE